MKLKIDVKSWNNYPPTHTHTSGEGLTLHPKTITNGCKIVQWDDKMQKKSCLDYIKLHGVHGNPSGTISGSEAYPLRLQADLKLTLACRHAHSFVDFFPSSTNSRKASCQLTGKQKGC